MKWGQGNQRFATMRLRGEKMKNNKREKMILHKIWWIEKCDKIKIIVFHKIVENTIIINIKNI